jgi:site-specific DNA-methyltransferase (adenine-specific)
MRADWQAGLIDIPLHGDCREILAQVPDGAVDTVWADPPYNLDIEYDSHDDAMDRDDYLEWSAAWLGEVVRVLKPDGHLFVLSCDEHAAELKILAEGRYGLAAAGRTLRRAGRALHPAHIITWYFTFGQNCRERLTRSHTQILHLVGHPKRRTWNVDAVRVPSARATLYNDKRASPEGRLPDDTWILRPADLDEGGFAADSDTWNANRVCGTYREKVHTAAPNQIPEQLVARALRLASNAGDLVLDPFGGTFTTAAVAKKLGRHFLSCDVSAAYVLQGKLRIESAKAGDMLDGPGELPGPAPAKRPAKVRKI